MTSTSMSLPKFFMLGGVEKVGIVVTAILVAINGLLGFKAVALGVALGGLLVIANFLVIKLLVNALIGGAYTKVFGIFIVLVKTFVLIAFVASLFLFTKVNIYGFLIGVSGVIIVIIGEGLRGNKDGSL